MKIQYRRNKHQSLFHDDLTSKLLHLSTGMGGGKTYALVMKAFQLSRINQHRHGGLLVPDYADFKRDVLVTFEEIAAENKIKLRYNNQDHTFSFPWTHGKLYVVTAEKKLRGPNWAYGLANEVTLCPLVRYKELIGRVRDKKASITQIATCGTPEGFASEYYDFFIEKKPDNLKIIYGSTLDNRANLSDDYVSNIEKTYDQFMLQTYLQGLWVNMTQNRFYYSYDPNRNDDASIECPAYATILCAMDFNVDPFCASFWYQEGGAVFCFDEIKLEGGAGYNTENMISAMKARGYKPDNTIIYPDPAGNQRRTSAQYPDNQILRNAGYQVSVKSVQPRLRERQISVNKQLELGNIKINPKCKGVKSDLMNVEQDKITLEKVKKVTSLTHFSDGMDYLIDILYPFTRPSRGVSSETIR